jgi:CHASE3 domain sensor protein
LFLKRAENIMLRQEVSMAFRWTVGRKLALGFGIVIAVFGSVGALSIWHMTSIKSEVADVRDVHVPEISLASGFEAQVLQMAFNARSYALTGEPSYLNEARAFLGTAVDIAKRGEELATREGLSELKSELGKVSLKLTEYGDLLAQSEAAVKAVEEAKAAASNAYEVYSGTCREYEANQTKKLAAAVQAGRKDEIEERIEKIRNVNLALDMAAASRIETLRALLTKAPKLFGAASAKLDESSESWTGSRSAAKTRPTASRWNSARTPPKPASRRSTG